MGMSKRSLAILAIGLALIGPAQAQRSSRYDVMDESTVTRTLAFAAGGGRTLDVRNVNGSIHVEGTDDAAVQMSIARRSAPQRATTLRRPSAMCVSTSATVRHGLKPG